MGVPRFRQLLEPYSQKVNVNGRNIIIDGPGLAYHTYHLCKEEHDAATLFDLPSYGQMGSLVVEIIEALSMSGANVVAIYFDGYLPSTKEPERQKRVHDLTKGLQTYKSLCPFGVPKESSSATRVQRKRLPTPAFLVPAVIEALCHTFPEKVKLVPGEADIFCARHVRTSGGIVLTSDSDLLVHDLGQNGSVAFFSTLTTEPETSTCPASVSMAEYSPWQISDRLSQPRTGGLSILAFCVNTDPQCSLQAAIVLARTQLATPDKASYAEFMNQYVAPETAEFVSLEPVEGLIFDPRIYELLLQFLARRLSGSDMFVSMYLPSLCDSPSRKSAWEASASLRQTAYIAAGLLNRPNTRDVLEYRRIQSPPWREGTCHSGQFHAFDHNTLFSMSCSELLITLDRIRKLECGTELQWVLFAIFEECRGSLHDERSALSLNMLVADAQGTLDTGSWDFVHLHAQTQGIYYSLRMIQQIYDFVSRYEHVKVPQEYTRLRDELKQHLPLLKDFPSLSDFATLLRQVRTDVDLEKFALLFEVDHGGYYAQVQSQIQMILNPPETSSRTTKSKKSKKRKRANKDRDTDNHAAKPGRRSNNPFDLLIDA